MNNTILIVDDMMMNIDILTNIFSDSYPVMAAISGKNAIQLMERKRVGLVLLDVSMPDIDGFGVLRYMKSRDYLSDIPVILVTGDCTVHTAEKALEMGVADIVKKPFSAAVISAKVRDLLEMRAYRNRMENLVQMQAKQLKASQEAIIMGMSIIADNCMGEPGCHIGRIKSYTRILTRKMQELHPELISAERADEIVQYSPLHDIGKSSISRSLLHKAGPLTHAEFDEVKRHTLHGAELLRRMEGFLGDSSGIQGAIEIAEYHHEKYDGSGYPHGLCGDDIPLAARIVTLADVYDALRSQKPYKTALTHDQAVYIVMSGDHKTKPGHFDPRILNAFSLIHSQLEEQYEKAMGVME